MGTELRRLRPRFLLIILGATDERAPQGFAPIAIGLGLTLIHLISIPVTTRWPLPPFYLSADVVEEPAHG